MAKNLVGINRSLGEHQLKAKILRSTNRGTSCLLPQLAPPGLNWHNSYVKLQLTDEISYLCTQGPIRYANS